MRDLYSVLKRAVSLAHASRTTSSSAGAAVDTAGYQSVAFEIDIGAGGITFTGTNRIDIAAEHSDDGSTWAVVPAADMRAPTAPTAAGIAMSVTAAHAAAAAYTVGYFGGKRYVRGTDTRGGTHATGTSVGISIALGHPLRAPVN